MDLVLFATVAFGVVVSTVEDGSSVANCSTFKLVESGVFDFKKVLVRVEEYCTI
jgi:hypothetical protein